MSENIGSTESSLKEDRQIKRSLNEKYTSKSLSHWKKKNKEDEHNNMELDDGSDSEDFNTCIVCAEQICLASISPCNHRVCHVCSFRQRALYLKRQCLVCRTENENLVFTEDLSLDDFESIKKSRFIPKFSNDHGIRYTSDYAKEKTLNLLKFICPIKSCSHHSEQLSNFKELNEHTREVHNKVYCSLCAKFKKAFISELMLYTPKQLQVHQSKGDQEGFNGHPVCKFCSGKRFYSDDELFIHMREKHEKCHICDQINPNVPQYFKNYDHLAQHFRDAHYVCNVQSCLDQKFVVFRDDFDLQAHMIKEHGKIFGGDNLLFSNSQSKFGSQLSTFETNNRKNKKKTSNENDNRDSYQTKKMRLEERAKHYLNYSQSDFDKFLVANTKYGNNEIDANELFKEYKVIFKNSIDVDYSILIYELAGLFQAKSSLRKNLEEINSSELKQKQLEEQFPELPGVDSSPNLLSNNWNNSSTTSLKSIPNRSGSSISIKTSSKLSRKAYSLPSLPKTNAVVFDSSPTTGKPGWLSSTARPKTRGISSNPMPINAISIPGFTPKSVTSNKSANAWGSKNPSTSLISPIPEPSKIKIGSDNKNVTVNYEFAPKLQKGKPIDERKFPKLPELQKRKPLPRVNPVNRSIGQWGSGPNPIIQNIDSDPFDMNNLQVSLKNTKKKKGKQVLYHIGI